MVHWVLIYQVVESNSLTGPGMNSGGVHVTIRGDVPWVVSLGVVHWPLKDAVVVIVPVELVPDSVVVVIQWVRSVATIEPLDQIVDSVVVIIQIVQIVNAIVVVILCVGLL